MQLVAPRGLSTRPIPIGRCSPPFKALGRLDRSVEQFVEERERLPELERPLLEPRLHIAHRSLGHNAGEALVVEASRRLAHVLGDTGSACGRADGTEPLGRLGVDDADIRQAILERPVEDELPPAARRLALQLGELGARGTHLARVEGEIAAADADAAEEEAVARERRV